MANDIRKDLKTRTNEHSGSMQICDCCLQWFCYNPNNPKPWGIEVKKRGYKSRYYCGECISNSKLSMKGELQNEHK